MKMMDMLKAEFVIEKLNAVNKRDVLAELIAVIAKGEDSVDPEAMLRIFLEREQLGSTGIGDGIAIPHGRLAGLDGPVLAFGRSRGGVAFEALDGKPVHLFFLLAAPENSAGQHLKVLAKISRMLKDGVFRKNLLEAKVRDDLVGIIAQKDDEC
jgi:PTS system nitrogen regulatory IIA component